MKCRFDTCQVKENYIHKHIVDKAVTGLKFILLPFLIWIKLFCDVIEALSNLVKFIYFVVVQFCIWMIEVWLIIILL